MRHPLLPIPLRFRQVLAIGLALAGLAAGPRSAQAIWPFGGEPLPDPVANPGAAAAQLLTQAIRLDTTNPPGDEEPLAALYVKTLKSHGVEAKLVRTPSAGSSRGRALAWGRVPGRGAGRPVVLLSHLDVVPASRQEWALPPFEGVVGGGSVVGRGALDAKGVGVVHLLTLAQLARRGAPLARDVIFLATPDEETGGIAGSGWLVKARRDLLRDAEFLLTEGGGILVGNAGSPPIWGVSVAEKSPCWLEVVARGTPGHSSAPTRDAAVPRLIAALDRVRSLEMPVRVVPEVERMFSTLSLHVAPEDRSGYRRLPFALAVDQDFRSRFLADRARAALVRNTLAITVLEGGPRTNVQPAEARAHLDVRLLPGGSCAVFADQIRATIADPGIVVETLLSFPATRSSQVATPLFEAIRRVAQETDPEAVVVPRLIAGFTDAHWFRELGIVSYGFVPRWLPPAETRGIHGPNERISIDNLARGVETLVRLLELMDQ